MIMQSHSMTGLIGLFIKYLNVIESMDAFLLSLLISFMKENLVNISMLPHMVKKTNVDQSFIKNIMRMNITMS